jgi:hypothetical protein
MSVSRKRLHQGKPRLGVLSLKVAGDGSPEPGITHVVTVCHGSKQRARFRVPFPQAQDGQCQRLVCVCALSRRAACRVAKGLDGGIV